MMKLADSSHRKLQAFFREFLSDENFQLPAINFYTGKFSRIFTLLIKVHGITFGRRIFIMPDLIKSDFDNRRRQLAPELAAHEIAHVLQYEKEGFIGFFYKYLTSYWRNLRKKENWDLESRHKAYLEIPFEIEAREIGAKFLEWNRNEKVIR